MNLGNSNGQNKGKKYLKLKGDEVITPENQAKADSFKVWFGDNYGLIRRELIAKTGLDEDVLTDTFLRLHDRIIYGGLEIACYKSYFCRAYYTNYVQAAIKEQNYAATYVGLDTIFHLASESSVIQPTDGKTKVKLKSIINYVRANFSEKNYTYFKSYLKNRHLNKPLSQSERTACWVVRKALEKETSSNQ